MRLRAMLATLLTAGLLTACNATRTATSPTLAPSQANPREPALVQDAAVAPPAWAPDLEQVAWAQVKFGLPMPEVSTPLYPERRSAREVLTQIVGWLHSSAPAVGEISPPSRAPYLHLRLHSGTTMTIRLAHDCVTEKQAESTRITCAPAQGQVIIHPPGGDPVRVKAPDLAAWLIDGWEIVAPRVPQVAATPLQGGLYYVEGNGWPEAKNVDIWLNGGGAETCCPPSNGTRLATTVPVSLGRFAWVGEIPGTRPASLTVVADDGGARGIQVEH